MSNMKNKYFDEINTGMEKARLKKVLATIEVTDLSPVFLINLAKKDFRLTEKEITEVVRNFYKF